MSNEKIKRWLLILMLTLPIFAMGNSEVKGELTDYFCYNFDHFYTASKRVFDNPIQIPIPLNSCSLKEWKISNTPRTREGTNIQWISNRDGGGNYLLTGAIFWDDGATPKQGVSVYTGNIYRSMDLSLMAISGYNGKFTFELNIYSHAPTEEIDMYLYVGDWNDLLLQYKIPYEDAQPPPERHYTPPVSLKLSIKEMQKIIDREKAEQGNEAKRNNSTKF